MRLVLIVAVFVAANRAYPSIDDLAARARAWVASQTPDDFLPYAGLTSSQFAWIPTLLPGAVDGVSRLSTVRSSMEGLRTVAIARAFGCYPQTVRECLLRFNVEGLDRLGDRPDSGPSRARPRPSRRILGVVATEPLGRLVRLLYGAPAANERRSARWTLDGLARPHGIAVERIHG